MGGDEGEGGGILVLKAAINMLVNKVSLSESEMVGCMNEIME